MCRDTRGDVEGWIPPAVGGDPLTTGTGRNSAGWRAAGAPWTGRSSSCWSCSPQGGPPGCRSVSRSGTRWSTAATNTRPMQSFTSNRDHQPVTMGNTNKRRSLWSPYHWLILMLFTKKTIQCSSISIIAHGLPLQMGEQNDRVHRESQAGLTRGGTSFVLQNGLHHM